VDPVLGRKVVEGEHDLRLFGELGDVWGERNTIGALTSPFAGWATCRQTCPDALVLQVPAPVLAAPSARPQRR